MYETLAKFAQTGGLILFVAAFVLVLIYALNPANKDRFERARRSALEDAAPAEKEPRDAAA